MFRKYTKTMASPSGYKARLKRNFAVVAGFLIFIFLIVILIYGKQHMDAQATAEAVDNQLPPVPYISAESAVLIEGASGRVLYEKDKDKVLPPASTTKIMTALIAVEWAEDAEINETKESETDAQLDHMFKISDKAAGIEGSTIYLEKDEEVSMRDLLYGMMLRSGNDAAIAVAEGVAGDADTFVEMMNSRAESLGLTNTHFDNPNGLHTETHVSTAYDLAILSREAMKHNTFRSLAETKVWNASRAGADNYNYFYNKNKIIFKYEGATGIKIGYTEASGRCLVASARKNGMELIAVVLNDHNWFEDAAKLFDYGFASYNNVKIADAEEAMMKVDIINGDKPAAAVGAKDEVICPSLKGQKTDISLIYDIPEQTDAPVSRWQQAGKLDVFSGENYVYSVPLYYLEDIDEDD